MLWVRCNWGWETCYLYLPSIRGYTKESSTVTWEVQFDQQIPQPRSYGHTWSGWFSLWSWQSSEQAVILHCGLLMSWYHEGACWEDILPHCTLLCGIMDLWICGFLVVDLWTCGFVALWICALFVCLWEGFESIFSNSQPFLLNCLVLDVRVSLLILFKLYCTYVFLVIFAIQPHIISFGSIPDILYLSLEIIVWIPVVPCL